MKNENGIEKSAILKGRTLVNIITNKTIEQGYIDGLTGTDLFTTNRVRTKDYINVNGSVTIKCFDNQEIREYLTYKDGVFIGGATLNNNYKVIKSDDTFNQIRITFRNADNSDITPSNLKSVILEGDYTQEDIPYFEGMQSVKMPVLTTTGKNLFDKTSLTQSKTIDSSTGEVTDVDPKWFLSKYMNVQGMDSITISSSRMYGFAHRYRFLDENSKVLYFKNQEQVGNQTYTVPNGSCYFQISLMPYNSNNEEQINLDTLMVEQGSTSTSYEPYKTNILIVNEEVELRAIGDVRDELNLLTGELTELIGEIVLDGSEVWKTNGSNNQRFFYYCQDYGNGRPSSSNLLSDKTGYNVETEIVTLGNITSTGKIQLATNFATVAELKEWLSSNPITVQYILATPTVKTVNLTIQDQNNQPQERMKLFPNGYINTSSSTFLPILELKGITHNNKLNMTTTNGTNNTQLATLDNLVLDGIVCQDGTVVRDSYDVESGLYTKRVFRFTIDKEFIETYKNNFVLNSDKATTYSMRIGIVTNCGFPKIYQANKYCTSNIAMDGTDRNSASVGYDSFYIQILKEELSSYDVNGILEWVKRNGAIEIAYAMDIPQIIHMQPNMQPYVSTRPYQGSIESQGNILESSYLDYTSEQSIISPKPLGDGDVLRWEQGSQCYVYENDKEYIPLTNYNQPMGTVLDLEEEDGEQFVENLDGGDIIVDVPFKEKAVYERHLVSHEDNVIYPTQDKLDPTGKIEVDYICGETWQNPNDLSDMRHVGALREDGQYDVTIRRSGDDEIRLMDGTTHISLDGDGLNPSEFELTFFNSGGVEVGKYGDTSHTLEDCVLDSKLETGTVYGQTLVNLMTNCKDEYVVRYHDINNPNNIVANISMMKPNTEYTLFYKAKYRTEGDGFGIGGSLNIGTSIEQGFITTGQTYTTEYNQYIYKITTSSVVDCFVFASNGLYFAIKECVLLEGDYTNYPMDIPFFEGVGSTVINGFTTVGKNLLDRELFIPTHNANIDLTMDEEGWIEANCKAPQTTFFYHVDLTKLPKGEYKVVAEYYEGFDGHCVCQLRRYDGKNDYYGIGIKIDTEIYYQVGLYMQTAQDVPTRRVKLRPMLVPYSETDLTYEPYHSVQYTLPTPITLNKVGDVCDTFDVVSGKFTQRIGEIILDGSEEWTDRWGIDYSIDGYVTFNTNIKNMAKGNGLCENFAVINNIYDANEGVILNVGQSGDIGVRLSSNRGITTINEFKQWLSNNPIAVYCQLATELVQTTDLIPSTVEMMQEPTFILPQPLRSVPNGICDRLYWDENKGHYCIEKRIGIEVFDGVNNFNLDVNDGQLRDRFDFSLSNCLYVDNAILCYYTNSNVFPQLIYNDEYNGKQGMALFSNGRVYFRYNSKITNAQFKQLLIDNPVDVIYSMSKSQIIDLPYLNKKLTLPTQPDTLPIGYKVEYPKANPQLGLTIPYKQLNYPSRPQNIDFKMDIADYVLTWDDVKEARQYNVILNDRVIATVKEPQWNSGEEMYGYIMVEAQNELADNLSEELYIKTVPNAPAQLTVAHNPMTDYYDFEISFIKTSAIAEYYTVQYRIDNGEWVYKTIQSDEIDPNTKVLWSFSVYEINKQIEVWATATNEIGTNDILPIATYYMSPTPQWTYRINSKELFVRWMDDSPYDTQYKLRYQYKSDGIYRYAYFEGDKQEIGKLYEALIPLADDEEVSIALCIISEKENLYTKPIKASKELDPNIKPPKNFNYHWLARGLIEFYWEDNYDVDVEYEAIVEHRLTSGNNEWITDTRIFSATDTEGTGTVYRLSYQLEDLEEIRVKVRMKWAMNETEWSESLTTVFIPVEGNPPQWIRRTQTQEGLLVEWEAQEYVDSYHVYVMSNGEELQHLETMDNFIYVDIDYSNPIDIEIYEATRFSGGIQSDPTDKMQFRPTMDKHQLIHDVVTPDTLTYEIEVDTIQKGIKERQVIHDINTTPKVTSKQPMDVSISSPFTLSFHPLQLDVHQAGSKYYGDTELHIKTLDVKSRDAIEVLTFERITDQYGVDFTVYTPSASKYPITLEVNRVRIVCFGDSLTSGHPGFWAETGTGDPQHCYEYWLDRRLKGQYEIINKG